MGRVNRKRLRERVAQHPRAVRFEELRRLLEAYGWALARINGSHHIFVRGGAEQTVPHRRPHVLPVYVRRALAACEEDDDGPDGAGDAD